MSLYTKVVKKKNLQQLSDWLALSRERLFEKDYKEKHDQINDLIYEIESEIRQRSELGTEILERPQTGMLGTMGYHVGEMNGKKEKVRISILTAIIKGPLPIVGSIEYTNQWSSDSSKERFQKLRNVLWKLRSSSNSEWVKARDEWTHDIEWLDANKDQLIK